MQSKYQCGVVMHGLEVRSLLSGDVAVDYPQGVFNATPNSLPSITVETSAIAPGGKIIVAGETVSPQASVEDASATNLIVMRYNTDGTIDSSFGTGGYSIFNFPDGNKAKVQNVVVQPSGKIVVASNGKDFARLNVDGSLDATFGNPGEFKDIKNDRSKFLEGVIAEPNGDLVVAFQTANQYARVMRFTPDGQVDGTFNREHAELRTDLQFGSLQAQLMLLPNGKILVKEGEQLTRLKTDGTTDIDFGDHGLVYVGQGTLVPTGDGDFLKGYDNLFERINADGQVESTFGIDGIATVPRQPGQTKDTEPNYAISALQPISGGDIAVFTYGNHGFTETRFTATGTLDKTFGANGVKSLTFSFFRGPTVLADADGGFFTVDQNESDGEDNINGDVQLLHFDSSGALTQAVGSAGPGEQGVVNALYPLSDNSVLGAGIEYTPTGGDFYLAKFKSDGTFDSSFGGGVGGVGWTSMDLGNEDDQAASIDVGPDGKIALGGLSGGKIAVAMFNSDGSPDDSFGDDGHETYSFEPDGSVKSLKFQSDGKLVIAVNYGDQFLAGSNGFTIARINADGTLDTTFNGDGFYTAPSSLFQASVDDLAIDHQGRIIAAGSYAKTNGSGIDLAIRFTANGTLDTSFNSTGIFHYHTTGDSINAISILPNDAILVAGSVEAGSAGNVGSIFEISSSGILYSKLPGAASNSEIEPKVSGHNLPSITGLAQDSEGRVIVFGGKFYNASQEPSGPTFGGQTIDVMRFTSALAPDSSFAANGVTEFNLPNADGVNSAAPLSDGSVVMATDFQYGRGPLFHLLPDTAPTSGVTVSGKTLRIVGTSGNDQITIKRVGSRIRVSINGVVSLFSRKQVSRIAATLLGGDDFLSIGAELPYATIFGGAGNDTLSSAGNRDSLIGGVGTDQIDGEGDVDQPSE